MTEADCKRVSLWMGRWHEPIPIPYLFPKMSYCSCVVRQSFSMEDMVFHLKLNRTYTTWQDFGDVFEKLVEKGEWRDFYYFAEAAWLCEQKEDGNDYDYNGIQWLFSKTPTGHYRLCELVSEWIRREEVIK